MLGGLEKCEGIGIIGSIPNPTSTIKLKITTMERQSMNEILDGRKGVDYKRLDKYLTLITQTSDMVRNLILELSLEFKIRGILVQDIKQNIRAIEKKLKSYPSLNAMDMDDDLIQTLGEDADTFENIAKGMIGLKDYEVFVIKAKYKIGEKVWTKYSGKLRLCEIVQIDCNLHSRKEYNESNVLYELIELNQKSLKPLKKDTIVIQEVDVVKSKKELLINKS